MDPLLALAFDDDVEETVALVLLAIILACGYQSRLLRAEGRRRHRLYLCRPELIPNPRVGSPWQVLYHSQSDRAFMTTMGMDTTTFHLLLDAGFKEEWDSTPIPRTDTNASGEPRLGARSLDAVGGLGLYLCYLRSSTTEAGLQLIFALVPSTVNRYLTFARQILLRTLRQFQAAAVKWPDGNQLNEMTNIVQARHPMLEGAVGTIDGLKLPIEVSSDSQVQNAMYNGWLHSHLVSNVFAFLPTGEIIHACLNAPGSWHDSRVARPLYDTLADMLPVGYYFVADTAFPRGTGNCPGKIQAPLVAGSTLPGDAEELFQVLNFNRQLLSYRQSAEWGMRSLQGGFGRLRVPLRIENAIHRQELLEICVRLHNVRVRCVGISQVLNVYQPIWAPVGDAWLWAQFERATFGEVDGTGQTGGFRFGVQVP